MKIAFSSDFHIDFHKENFLGYVKDYLLKQKVDIFCFAGDMCENVRHSVDLIKNIQNDTGIKVLAIPGNHEIRDRSFESSFDALQYFNFSLGEISLMNESFCFDDWVIIGNMGWYDYSTSSKYFNDYELNKMEYRGSISKDQYCNWRGLSHVKVADYFLEKLHNEFKKFENKNIILISHIVPYREYVLEKNEKAWDYWNAFFGNVCIGDLADKFPVKYLHFGHTHTRFTETRENGMNIICSPLGYQKEWKNDCIEKEIISCIKIIDF